MPRRRKRVCIVLTSRAAYGRLRTFIAAADKHPDCELQLVLAASAVSDRHGSILGSVHPKPSAILRCQLDDDSPSAMATTTGVLVAQLAPVLEHLQPDCVVAHADRYETLAVAIAASYQGIPVVHTQGGERSGSLDDRVRDAVTMLATTHFVCTDQAGERVNSMRQPRGIERVYNLGCPSLDTVFEANQLAWPRDFLIDLDTTGRGAAIAWHEPFTLVAYHPDLRAPIPDELYRIAVILETVQEYCDQTVWIWPNVDAGSETISKPLRLVDAAKAGIRFYRNLHPTAYARLLVECKRAIGNSSSFLREGAAIGTPTIMVGGRQAEREIALNVTHWTTIPTVGFLARELRDHETCVKTDPLYGLIDGQIGARMVDTLVRD